MKIIRLLLLGSVIILGIVQLAIAQPDEEFSYWKFWSGNSPNTLSIKDSISNIKIEDDSTSFILSSFQINAFVSQDTIVFKDYKYYNQSQKNKLIFDESLKTGDTIVFEYEKYLIDTLKDTTLLDGKSRKLWKMHAILNSGWFYPANWIEGIGEIRQGFNWITNAGTASLPIVAAICNSDSLIYWKPFMSRQVTPSCDFDYLDTYLGITDNARKSNLTIYPNPSQHFLNFDVELNNASYKIYNTNGQLLQEGNIQQQVNIASLPNGLYFIEVLKDNTVIRQKFVNK